MRINGEGNLRKKEIPLAGECEEIKQGATLSQVSHPSDFFSIRQLQVHLSLNLQR